MTVKVYKDYFLLQGRGKKICKSCYKKKGKHNLLIVDFGCSTVKSVSNYFYDFYSFFPVHRVMCGCELQSMLQDYCES